MTMCLSSQPQTTTFQDPSAASSNGAIAASSARTASCAIENALSGDAAAPTSPVDESDRGSTSSTSSTSHASVCREGSLVTWKEDDDGEHQDGDGDDGKAAPDDDEAVQSEVPPERLLVDSAIAAYSRQRFQLQQQNRLCHTHHRQSPAELKAELERVEARIFKAARLELELLNRSKALRIRREVLTKKYRRMCLVMGKLQQQQSRSQGERRRGEAGGFVPVSLPPLLPMKVYDLAGSC